MDPIEIRADGVDSRAVVADLAARARGRGQDLDLPSARLDLPPPFPEDRRAQLAAWLDRARRVATRLSVDANVGWHTPVLGPFWNVLRRLLYRDLRLYADAVTSKQMVYNEALVEALTLLVDRVADLEADAREHGAPAREAVARLAQSVAGLEQRLEAIEQQLATLRGLLGARAEARTARRAAEPGS